MCFSLITAFYKDVSFIKTYKDKSLETTMEKGIDIITAFTLE